MRKSRISANWTRAILVTAVAALIGAIIIVAMNRKPPPVKSEPIHARLELAAGNVTVTQQDKPQRATSGTALRAGAVIDTGPGARALVRLPDGSAAFVRGDSKVTLQAAELVLDAGEYWLDAPPLEREGLVQRVGDVQVTAADAGLSVKRNANGAVIYVARGMAVVSSKGGRVEVNAGEQAAVTGTEAPEVTAVAFWDDWTGGMADGATPLALGAGAATIYGVDVGATSGSPARQLQVKKQSVRAVLRDGLSETEVDQTFFNASARAVEGWYWFVIPEGASVTGFAVETDGVLVDGEVIERRAAAKQYGVAKASGHAPAILEWVDGRSYRARIFPVPASGTRRVVLRYLELRPMVDGKLTYVYPMGRGTPTRIGEFSLAAELGAAGGDMDVATLDEARVDHDGQRVTMRRSGFTPRADFQLEATLKKERPPLSVARFQTGGDAADYVMARYTPDVDWAAAKEPNADVVVVVDTSADGDEATRQLQKTAAEAILRALSAEDRFALVSLDVSAKVLHPAEGMAKAEDGEIATALDALADHASGGATDLSALFDVALGRVHGATQPAVVYVGDGLATSGEMTGEQLIERMRRALSTSRARLFTLGVGATADHLLLGELARAGGGQSFDVLAAGRASSRALELVAAVKVPTITDFELDLGAGLDEPLTNVSGKVPRGTDVVMLARTHHDLPKTAMVRGRLGGEAFEQEVEIVHEQSVVSAFVPRLWAAAYVHRLLGGAAGPEAERGRVVALGIEYGLVTPYTSVLALESEEAYSRMGIQRRRSPLRGVRLGALDLRGEHSLAAMHTPASAPLAFGCNTDKSSERSAQRPVEADENRPPAPSTQPVAAAPTAVAAAAPEPEAAAGEEGRLGEAPPTPAADVDRRPAATPPGRAAADRDDSLGGAEKKKGIKPRPRQRPRPTPTKPATAKIQPESELVGDAPKRTRKAPVPVVGTCSDVARRPLAQRMALWRKRMRTATSPVELLARHISARRACELDDWTSERAFLQLLQRHVRSEAGATMLLRHLGERPEVQRFVARLILRRSVDQRIVAAVEQVLFGGAVNWNLIDIELSEIETLPGRIDRLRRVMAKAPDDPHGQIRLVDLLAEAGQADEALAAGRRLRDRGLLTVDIARQLGDVLARAGLEQEAVRTYSEIVEFDPTSLPSRVLLGDIYLAHGWYEPAYRQFRTATQMAPNDALGFLRLAAAAAGSGRIDEALRLERRVASAQGRPGPSDPRRWGRLWSAARISRLIAEPPEGPRAPSRASLERRLKELGLFGAGPSRLVLVTWEDLQSNVALVTRVDDEAVALGEQIDAAPVGLAAALLSPAEMSGAELVARLRSSKRRDPLTLTRHDVAWDGKAFVIDVTQTKLAAGKTGITL